MSEIVIPDKDEFKIGEVCDIAGVKPFVLRYWETEFPELAPAKGAGGQRTYSRVDVQLILRIKQLLYEERFTVAGAKKRLSEEQTPRKPPKKAKAEPPLVEPTDTVRRTLADIRREIEDVVALLR